MGTIEACVRDIPMDQLKNAEAFTLESLHMDRDRVMERYAATYEDTLERCFKEFKCHGMYKPFAIVARDGDEIQLEGGLTLKSKVLADALSLADEVVAYAATVNGHDELMEDPENGVLENMFYNAWGVGFSMSAHRWLKKLIQDQIRENGRYAGRGWIPGEEGVEIGLQKDLFKLIDPGQIGITLSGSVMRPVMSINGFMGISDDSAIEVVGGDDSERR